MKKEFEIFVSRTNSAVSVLSNKIKPIPYEELYDLYKEYLRNVESSNLSKEESLLKRRGFKDTISARLYFSKYDLPSNCYQSGDY